MSALVTSALRAIAVLGLMLFNAVVLTSMTRRMHAHLELGLGPVGAGWRGALQAAADVVKLLAKGEAGPSATDRALFVLAPSVVFLPSVMAYLALPLSRSWTFAELDAGVLYVIALLSIIPLGVLMAGWSSGAPWSLADGVHAAVRRIDCVVPLLLSLAGVVMLAGSLDMNAIVEAQRGVWLGFVPRWFVLPQAGGFAVFLAAAVVGFDTPRVDMSSAGPQAVATVANQYSGTKYGLFLVAEFSNSFIVSAVAVTLFFGGWLDPFGVVPGPVAFLLKTYVGILVLTWIRASMPSIGVRRSLSMIWKVLVPAGLAWVLVTSALVKSFEATLAGAVG